MVGCTVSVDATRIMLAIVGQCVLTKWAMDARQERTESHSISIMPFIQQRPGTQHGFPSRIGRLGRAPSSSRARAAIHAYTAKTARKLHGISVSRVIRCTGGLWDWRRKCLTCTYGKMYYGPGRVTWRSAKAHPGYLTWRHIFDGCTFRSTS